ncbi:NAD(P)-dependent dehydrogenase (short-subunit alcohol dehydrogenase family) [Deinobacterium chartae]|uniref:NAD(P)-dependent dehydrogenase (Short-subunit alcohol dehydrogenase family) n=1 Tax=Deinobacterium chartae TaxID=521158 RepID=A0A841I5P7_9DEIO|nr:SDR family oxidoreductase [Deinobacterium chartae]MBB6099252.1 NAD(P)-dependent dehydrogenase (short-subunit alcohol dehydrogenase family) [Deinobacterium chartae]
MSEWSKPDLSMTVALVAGATRGAGRGMAVQLGACGATVICTGRSTREHGTTGRPETIDETAELVTAAGGRGVAIRCDHSDPGQVEALFERVRAEFGQLDVLVNDLWGGEKYISFGPFWETPVEHPVRLIPQALISHIITARLGVPLMLERGRGLILEITDGDTLNYRGSLLYDLVKTSVIRLAQDMAADFDKAGLDGMTAVALTPGFLRSEEMLDHFGVTEANWRDAVARDPYFAESETPAYIGRAVAHLAADPDVHVKNGMALATWHLSREYGFVDADGRRPHWQEFFERMQREGVQPVFP